MNYAIISIVALPIHFILNHKYFTNQVEISEASRAFKHFLWAALGYYVTDALWGMIYDLHVPALLYIDTIFYYITMAMTVVLMCRYVTAYLKLDTRFGKFINSFGVAFSIFEIVLLVVNHFVHIFYWIDSDGVYHASKMRYAALYMQVFLLTLLAIQTGSLLRHTAGEMKKRHFTIFLFCVEMTIAVIAQIVYPLLPLYAAGLVLGIAIIHTFVQEGAMEEQYMVLRSLSDIQYSMHVIDLTNDTVIEFSAKNEVREIVNRQTGAARMMTEIMSTIVTDEHKSAALNFTDLTTVADRMQGKKTISAQFIGKRSGWFSAMFIAIETDAGGKPTKLIYTTRIIDEEKKQEQKLLQESLTDEMTGFYNRRAYEEDVTHYAVVSENTHFNYVSLDLNSLKVVNDTKGHAAGDEMIIGACQCIRKCLAPYGKLYRTGGDEFVAVLLCSAAKAKEILADFDDTVSVWSGKLVDSLSVSYGCVSKEEKPEATLKELEAIAEQRMYAAKAEYYKHSGMDRRGQKDAHTALCALYTKILRINLADDSYQIVNMDISEQTQEKGFADSISQWLKAFALSGQVHPDDVPVYLKKTDTEYLLSYFSAGKTSLHIFYRRRYGNEFKQVMMEIIPASNYCIDNPSFFLYVKNIDK